MVGGGLGLVGSSFGIGASGLGLHSKNTLGVSGCCL